MRSYHQLIFDENVEGTTAVQTDPRFNTLLAMTERLDLVVIATQASGTNPTLIVASQVSGDNRNWVDRLGTPEINGQALSTTGQTVLGAKSAATEFTGGFVRLNITLGGTGPKARLQIWATGRGEQILQQ